MQYTYTTPMVLTLISYRAHLLPIDSLLVMLTIVLFNQHYLIIVLLECVGSKYLRVFKSIVDVSCCKTMKNIEVALATLSAIGAVIASALTKK